MRRGKRTGLAHIGQEFYHLSLRSNNDERPNREARIVGASSQKLPCRTSPPTVGATTMGSLAIPDFGFGETPLWENRK
jgi:hypothetical protein